jgi:hypothetical protein
MPWWRRSLLWAALRFVVFNIEEIHTHDGALFRDDLPLLASLPFCAV